MADKRPAPGGDGESDGGLEQAVVVKRQKTEANGVVGTLSKEGVKRTSNLAAPILQLSGHGGEVFCVKFNPEGSALASASFDKLVYLWRTYGESENFMMLKGHKSAVLDLHWLASGENIITCSADRTVRAWDVEVGEQIKKLTEHNDIVNACCPMKRGSPALFVSGSDDGSIKVWDMRAKRSVQTMPEKFQVTSVAFSEAGDMVYSGGIDNTIKVWDLRLVEVAMVLPGHTDTITGLSVSPDGTFLLSNAMDNTLRIWDMRPYAPANRCVKVLVGHQHNFEKTLLRCAWSADGARVTCGSADRMVNVWDVFSRRLIYKLPGHKGSVNEVVFHPEEPVVASASSDRTIFLGELAENPSL